MQKYVEVASFNINSTKQMVISLNNEGNLVIAKRIMVRDEDEGIKTFFEKGSTIVREEYFGSLKEFADKLSEYLAECLQ